MRRPWWYGETWFQRFGGELICYLEATTALALCVCFLGSAGFGLYAIAAALWASSATFSLSTAWRRMWTRRLDEARAAAGDGERRPQKSLKEAQKSIKEAQQRIDGAAKQLAEPRVWASLTPRSVEARVVVDEESGRSLLLYPDCIFGDFLLELGQARRLGLMSVPRVRFAEQRCGRSLCACSQEADGDLVLRPASAAETEEYWAAPRAVS